MKHLKAKLIYKSLRIFNTFRSLFYKKPDGKLIDNESFVYFNKNRPFGYMPKICYVPWVNLFFNTDGKALVCCKNTKVILGKYPEMNLNEMWFNPIRKELQNYITHNDLSLGCYKCKDTILQKNVHALTSVYFDKYGLTPISKYPKVLEFEISNKCNLKCVMCSERVSSAIAGKAVKNVYDDNFVTQLNEFIPHLKEAKFFGGEPFLIPQYYAIWENIKKLNPSCKIFIQTNGTLLDDKIKSIITDLSCRVNVSLDAIKKDTYESIRRNAVFENTMSNIEWFGKNTAYLGIVAAPFRMNWKEMPEIIDFCNKNRYFFSTSTVYHPKELALWSWEVDKLKMVSEFYQNIALPDKTHHEKINKQVFKELTSAVAYWLKQKELKNTFDNDFQSQILSQEKEMDSINYTDENVLTHAKPNYLNLLKQYGMEDKEISEFENILKTYFETTHTQIKENYFYVFLKNEVNINDVIYFVRHSDKKAIFERIKTLLLNINSDDKK